MRLFVLLAVTNLIFLVAAQKDADENRPYKFGFNIEGHQHRKEEKDEKGIIRGEYGFITADGYYRVTVYETDEQGRFKIVSQKNYYVGFPPGDPTTTPNTNQISVSPVTRAPQTPSEISNRPDPPSTKPPIGKEGASCGSCLLPTKPVSSTTAKPNQPPTKPVSSTTTNANQPPTTPEPSKQSSTSFRDLILVKSLPEYMHEPDPPTQVSAPSPPQQGIPRTGDPGRQPTPEFQNRFTTTKPPFTLQTLLRETPPKKIAKTNELPKTPVTPVKINPQQDNTLTNSPNQPNNLLYTFNYTAGFHGHHEDGYRNGDKSGDYFVNGRDGVSRRVGYIANEFGYQPNITITQLKENDERRPKEETEKSFGLKGYEFKWFYRK